MTDVVSSLNTVKKLGIKTRKSPANKLSARPQEKADAYKVSHHTLSPKIEFKPPFTFWVSRLYHKLVNNTMENIRVVITIFAVSCEVLHSLGTPRRKKEP